MILTPAARTWLSTTAHARQRHLVRKAGNTRHVARHDAQRNTITVTVPKPPSAVAEPRIRRSRRPWTCSVRPPHRHSLGRYDDGSRIRAS